MTCFPAKEVLLMVRYRSSGVEPFTDIFARPEDRNALFGHLDLNSTSWISANATCSILYEKCAKAP